MFKLFEEHQIRPIDIEIVNKEPIELVIKYTDYTNKTLNRKGINETNIDFDIDIDIEGMLRFDSLYNNYSLSFQEENLIFTESKDGNYHFFYYFNIIKFIFY